MNAGVISCQFSINLNAFYLKHLVFTATIVRVLGILFSAYCITYFLPPRMIIIGFFPTKKVTVPTSICNSILF